MMTISLTDEHTTGLQAGWLNSWLAAIGIVRLLPAARLRWEGRGSPRAVFEGLGAAPAETIACAIPTLADLDRLVIARSLPGYAELPRKVGPHAYRERAAVARVNPGDWSLSATVTDLVPDDEIAHAPFDPAVPKGLTLHQRVRSCREKLPVDPASLVSAVASTLAGRGHRVQSNGLGFDVTRSSASVDASAKVMVDPVIECLAFQGLQLFPMRGDGQRAGGIQRGFAERASRRRAFHWPAWREPLDLWAVDALLDQVASTLSRDGDTGAVVIGRLRRLGVFALYGSVYQRPRSSSDSYRAYGGERIW